MVRGEGSVKVETRGECDFCSAISDERRGAEWASRGSRFETRVGFAQLRFFSSAISAGTATKRSATRP